MEDIAATLNEVFQRLRARPNVAAVILMNREGQLIKSSLPPGPTATQYASCATALVESAQKALGTLNEAGEASSSPETLNLLRVKSTTREFLIAPDGKYIFVVIQSPNEATGENVDSQTPSQTPTSFRMPTPDTLLAPPVQQL